MMLGWDGVEGGDWQERSGSRLDETRRGRVENIVKSLMYKEDKWKPVSNITLLRWMF